MNDFQGQIDFIKGRFRDTMTKFDQIVEKMNTLHLSMDNQKSEFDKIKQDNLFLHTENKEMRQKLTECMASLLSQVKYNEKCIDNVSNMQQICKEEQTCIKKQVESLHKNMANIEDKQVTCAKQEFLDQIYAELKQFQNSQFSLNNAIETKHNLIFTKQFDNDSKISLLLSQVDAGKHRFDQHLQEFTSSCRKIGASINSVLECIDSVRVNLTQIIDDKIAAIPGPIIPSLDEAKKQFQSQLEPISLDARNSYLRSQNNEIKINVVSKKVEQLTLLVNKLTMEN